MGTIPENLNVHSVVTAARSSVSSGGLLFLRILCFLGLFSCYTGMAWALEPVTSSAAVNAMLKNMHSGQITTPQMRIERGTASVIPNRSDARKNVAPHGIRHSQPSIQRASAAPLTRTLRERGITTGLKTRHNTVVPQGDARGTRIAVPKLSPVPIKSSALGFRPAVKAKALYCLDCSSNKILFAENTSEPLPIASITKLITAMIVIEEMELEKVLEVPQDIPLVERHVVGLKPGDLLSVNDLLHGMLIESGNDCAEVLARAYPKGGRDGFIAAMNRKAAALGASTMTFFTPSGLDMKVTLGRKEGMYLEARKANTASAEEVASIAREAFKNKLISRISSTKSYTMRTRNSTPRDYPLVSNDKLLSRNLPVIGAKTGYTNQAGRCIVVLFKDKDKEHMVVVLNTPHHFKAAEKVYRWANKPL